MKDIMGAALLGELVGALAKSTILRRSLGGVAPEDADAMIRTMVSEIERLAAESAVRIPPPPKAKPSEPMPVVQPKPSEPMPVVQPKPEVRAVAPVSAEPSPRPVVAELPAPQAPAKPVPVVTTLAPTPAVPPVQSPPRSVAPPLTPPMAPANVPVSPSHSPVARVPMPFETERAFVLAASLIPLQDTPSRDPFKLGGEGIDQGSELFAIDHAGIRFFLSTLKNPEAGVSKAGMLLLGKQESIKHRCVHERLVNILRLHSLILPAEAGTVVLGRDDLVRRVDFRLSALFEILLGLSTLSLWRVSVSVLDAQVLKMLPADAAPARTSRHEGERGRVSPTSKKTDIKTLERLLTREKKLAEAILQKLASAADGHTVESMVNLGSGSSEDWKPILRAAFEVSAGRFGQFALAVVECQDANAMFDPMIAVAGGPGSFSLSM